MVADLPRSFQTELILGGQKSGKSRRAEQLARRWLDEGPDRKVVLIATALGADTEMQARIARHRADRAAWLPEAQTVEEPLALARALRQHSRADTLVVDDDALHFTERPPSVMPTDEAATVRCSWLLQLTAAPPSRKT